MEAKFHRKITSQTLHFGSQNHQKTAKNQFKKHSKKQLCFKTLFFGFWEGLGCVGNYCWACFCLPKSIFFALFSKFQFFIDSGAFWEGLGRVWGGFGESFGRVWGGFGEVWRGFGKILGMKFSSHWRNEGRPADCALRSPPPHRRWRSVLDSESTWLRQILANIYEAKLVIFKIQAQTSDYPLSISPPGLAHSAGPAQNLRRTSG